MGMDIKENEGRDIIVYQFPDFIKEKKNYVGNNLNDYEILGILEDGENSKVIKVKSKIDDGIYAMKQIELRLIDKYNLYNEIELLKEIDHPNIIKCYNIFDEGNYRYIIMEFMNNGDLQSYKELNRTFGINITENKIIEFGYNCLSALEYIHSKGRNRQIRLKNIFIDDNFNLKLGIFNITSLIAFEPNQNQNKLDIQIFGNVLDNLLSYKIEDEKNKLKLNTIKSFITELINGKFDSTNDVKSKIKEMYIKNCVKNTSIKSVLYCLNNFNNLKLYFYDSNINNIISKNSANKNKILSKQFLKTIYSLNKVLKEEKDSSNEEKIKIILNKEKQKIYDSLYELRKSLEKVGLFIKNDNTEINPEHLISFILVKLHSDLCETTIPKNIDDKRIYKILSKNSYYNINQNEKLIFKVLFNIYKEKFSSYISTNFLNFIKVKSFCNNCRQTKIRFSLTYFLHILTKDYSQKQFPNIDISNILYSGNIKEKCQKCNEVINNNRTILHNIEISLYKPARNLILILDRGKNYLEKTFIDFDENLSINNKYYEVNANYNLKGIISLKQKEYNYYKCYIKIDNNWSYIDFKNKDENKDKKDKKEFNIINIQLNEIKNKDLIICLFYELENDKISYEDRELQNVYESIIDKEGNINLSNHLGLKKCNSSKQSYNIFQNLNTSINNNSFQIHNQSNINLQLQNNISHPMDINKFSFNTFISNNNNNSFNKFGNNIIENNNFGFNNQPIIENKMSADNPNNLVYMDDFQNNVNLNSNKTNINQSPNNFFSSFDSSGSIRDFSKTIYQNNNNDIPQYFNQEYDIIEEEKIDDINEITNRKIGFL